MKFAMPEIEVIKFAAEDVITTSGNGGNGGNGEWGSDSEED